jgi:uncharacterized protein (TIGR03437 family)
MCALPSEGRSGAGFRFRRQEIVEATGLSRKLVQPVVVFVLWAGAAAAQNFRGQIGVEIEAAGEGSRSRAFVDLGRVFRPWTLPDGATAAPVDANGWPTADAQTVFFDVRPIPAWAPPIDDPARFQPDWSGTYHLSFSGQATLSGYDTSGVSVENQVYDPAANITTADVIVKLGAGVLSMTFTNTKRTATSAAHTGITNLRLIRPGYAAGSTQVYTNEFLDSLAPFSTIRFMSFTATNDSDPAYPAVTNWSDRHVMTDATQQSYGAKHGAAWEYAILLANQTGKDIWINIPASATDDYVRQLATLLHARLNPALKIYIEHSNEVWNSLFGQNAYNQAATQAEVQKGGSPLDRDGMGNLNTLVARRHAKRLVEIGNIFKGVYGDGAINDSVRVVYAWWTIFPDQYEAVLNWVKQTYGPPSQFFYALAQTHYFSDSQATSNAITAGVLAAMRADSDNGIGNTDALHAVAQTFGLQHVVYEGGPDSGGGSATNVGNRILANRDPGMRDLIEHDMRDNWFGRGGDLYMYFTLSGAYNRYGCWGLTEDIVSLNTVKFQAVQDLVGEPPTPIINSGAVLNSASGAAIIAPGSFVSIYGQNFTSLAYGWDWTIPDGKTLPTMVAGARVRINNQDAYVSYASPTQLDVLAPPGVFAGTATVDVITGNGTVSAAATMLPISPAFFTYSLAGYLYLAAVYGDANELVYVAPAGALDGFKSRPAKSGDNLELFAEGLGPTAMPYPAGQVLAQPYPVADLSQVQVTVDNLPAVVQFAGMTFAGVFQVNIQVPQLTRGGDLPVVLTVDGQSTPANALLNFQR